MILKSWNKEVCGALNSQIDRFKEEVSKVDSLTDLRPLSTVEIDSRSIALADLWSLLRIRDSQLFQRYRSKRIKDGDTKSSYFHAHVKSRNIKHDILTLKVGEDWI